MLTQALHGDAVNGESWQNRREVRIGRRSSRIGVRVKARSCVVGGDELGAKSRLTDRSDAFSRRRPLRR